MIFRGTLCAAALALALLSGCQMTAHQETVRVEVVQGTWIREEIFCGMGKPTGGFVTEAEWQKFVDEEVTPLFPQGLTIVSAGGQWKGDNGKVEREPSRVLVLFYNPAQDPTAEGKARSVAQAYGKRFGQEAVLAAKSSAAVEFIEGSAKRQFVEASPVEKSR